MSETVLEAIKRLTIGVDSKYICNRLCHIYLLEYKQLKFTFQDLISRIVWIFYYLCNNDELESIWTK